MIIDATFNDNDFTYILTDFFNAQLLTKVPDNELSYKACRSYIDNLMNFQKLLEYSPRYILSKPELKNELISLVEKSIYLYLNKYAELSDATKLYLGPQLKVKISDQFKIKDQNGEHTIAYLHPYGCKFVIEQ